MKPLYACLIFGVIASSAQADTLPTAKAPEIVDGIRSCLAAVDIKGVDAGKLRLDGWSTVSASQDGKPVSSPIPMLSKGNLLLIHQSDAEAPICAIMGRATNLPAVAEIKNAIDGALKTNRKVPKGKAIPAYWFPSGHIVELATTGSVGSPGVRVVVGYRNSFQPRYIRNDRWPSLLNITRWAASFTKGS